MNKYDAILTLGNGLSNDWKLPEIVKIRLEYVAKLYKRRVSNTIIVSGGYSLNWDKLGMIPPTTEAEEMKKALVELGVKAEDILKEDKSKDTIGNFYFTKSLYLKPRAYKKILIVCTDFHMFRVRFFAKKILGTDYSIRFKSTPSECFKDNNFMKIQKNIFRKQRKVLDGMKDGDENFLRGKLYFHPFYQEEFPIEITKISMQGVR